jgi:hypothetical protein
MKNCAAKLGLDWGDLSACGGGARGQALLTQSGAISKKRHIEYGLQGRFIIPYLKHCRVGDMPGCDLCPKPKSSHAGLPVVHINGVEIKTHKPIPIVCGPSAHVGSDGSSPGAHPEVLEHLCALLKASGNTPQKCQKY